MTGWLTKGGGKGKRGKEKESNIIKRKDGWNTLGKFRFAKINGTMKISGHILLIGLGHYLHYLIHVQSPIAYVFVAGRYETFDYDSTPL